MEKDFHYYLTYAIVKLIGLPQSEIIAYACQFVDDNNEGQFSIGGEDTFFPEKLSVSGGYYYPVMTQSLSPKSLDPYVQKYVYVPFHFLPGDNTVTIDGKTNPLCTTPNSTRAKAILSNALESNNPYLTGIAIHTFADTWSHQNFTGLQEEWNAVYPWYNVFKSLVPNIGHAEAGHSPDVISEPWIDYRLNKKHPVDNKQRAFDAVEAIYIKIQEASRTGTPWRDVKEVFRNIINANEYDERIGEIDALLGSNIPNYDKNKWIAAAIDKSGGSVVISPDFLNSDWYHFHQAAKIHLASVMDLVKEI